MDIETFILITFSHMNVIGGNGRTLTLLAQDFIH